MKATHRNGEPPYLLKMAVNSNNFFIHSGSAFGAQFKKGLYKCSKVSAGF